jgi:hypothetical protein
MRGVWAATLALCAAADMRIETDVSLEVILDDQKKTLRARLDEDPAHAARAFCAAAAVAVECEERVTKALRAEQDAVRVRTNQILPEEPPRRLPRRQAPPRKEDNARETSATVSVSLVVDGRGFQVEAGIDEAPHAAAARFCRERNVTPRDCNVISLALAEKQDEARRGRRGSDDRAADLARQKLVREEEGWGDHLFSGAVSDEAPPPVTREVTDATSIDYSVRIPPSLRVTFRGRDGEVVVERYLGETAEAAVARACRAAKASADECADLQSAFACKVTPSADCEAAQARKDAEPARLERLRRLSTLAALVGAVAIAYFQHRAQAQAGV